tara:strand:+ start:35 stop:1063 length:1029 start_codon:yes stop_codon:yes gene_type:complete
MKILDRNIGSEYEPLVIAEIGINHGGSLNEAKKLALEAFKSGAEIIKHQTHIVDKEMSYHAKEVIPGNADTSIYEIMDQNSLSLDEEIIFKEYVESLGIIYISTPFSLEAAIFLNDINVPAFKVGSGEFNNLPLVEKIASFKKPMILSSGMNSMYDVEQTVKLLEEMRAEFAILHTTNLYPTPPHLVRLGAMKKMMDKFPHIPMGLSDHTTSNLACFGAVSLGACILERHFTDTLSRPGPDIINSMDPKQLNELVKGSIEIWKMRGGEKEAALEEKVTIDFAFSSVVATKDIITGDTLSEDNIWVKRPGNGEIHARDFNKLIGKKAIKNIKADQQISYEDFT